MRLFTYYLPSMNAHSLTLTHYIQPQNQQYGCPVYESITYNIHPSHPLTIIPSAPAGSNIPSMYVVCTYCSTTCLNAFSYPHTHSTYLPTWLTSSPLLQPSNPKVSLQAFLPSDQPPSLPTRHISFSIQQISEFLYSHPSTLPFGSWYQIVGFRRGRTGKVKTSRVNHWFLLGFEACIRSFDLEELEGLDSCVCISE